MDTHLPVLHEIMCNSVQQFRDFPTFTHLLTQQLQSITEQRNTVNIQSAITHPARAQSDNDEPVNLQECTYFQETDSGDSANGHQNTDSPDFHKNTHITQSEAQDQVYSQRAADPDPCDITCSKCKRPCKTRSVLCQLGSHWIHYRCDKLTSVEIDRLHGDQGVIFNCKDCQKHNTAVKKTISPNKHVMRRDSSELQLNSKRSLKRCSSAPHLKLPRLNNDRESNQPTSAADILQEEASQLCTVCSRTIAEDDIKCEKCKQTCHISCMYESNSDMCISCTAAEAQMNLLTILEHAEDTQPPSCNSSLTQSSTPTLSGSQSPLVSTATPISVPDGNEININIPQASQKHVPSDTTKPNKQNVNKKIVNKPDSDSIIPKHRDLRQQETKLKKWENELKLREAKIDE